MRRQGVIDGGAALHIRRTQCLELFDIKDDNVHHFRNCAKDIILSYIGAGEYSCLKEHLIVVIQNYPYESWLELEFCNAFFIGYKECYDKVCKIVYEDTNVTLETTMFIIAMEKNAQYRRAQIAKEPSKATGTVEKKILSKAEQLDELRKTMAELKKLQASDPSDM